MSGQAQPKAFSDGQYTGSIRVPALWLPARRGSGLPAVQYLIQSTFSTKIYFGDPVIKSAASLYITPATGTGSVTALTGVFVGCQYTPTGGIPTWSPYWPGAAAADATAYVIDAPNALFRAAALLTAVPATAIGQGIGYSNGAGGTTVGGGFSTYVVDQSTMTTGAVAPFQVFDVPRRRERV